MFLIAAQSLREGEDNIGCTFAIGGIALAALILAQAFFQFL